jgi:excinuclease ABC subunit C
MQEKLSSIPRKPGIYIFKDEKGRILYVGKAKDLRNRVRSYFRKSSSLDVRKSAMLESVRDFEYTVTTNELEAFVLEANLIKQHKPRYNILLRDDKSYPYLKLTLNEKWPRISVVRRIQKDGAKYYGPYVPSGAMWEILSFIRNHYNIPACGYSLEKRMRPCIQHQIKKCIAPCSGDIDHGEYMGRIREVQLLLEGKNKGLIETLEKKMERLSEETKYEEAALVRDRIRAIRKISESQKAVAPELGDMDVIGISRSEDTAAFKMLFIRNGIMIGSRNFLVRDAAGETAGYLFRNFLRQFYEKEILPPPEILCSSLPEDHALLASWLSERRGSRVRMAVPGKGVKRKLLDMAEENAAMLSRDAGANEKKDAPENIAAFLGLEKVPEAIGAFDISNIAGREPVGAFVYWTDGRFRKDKYRHIRMDAVPGPDDYSMMKEMIRRTFRKAGVRSEERGVRRKDDISSPLTPHPSPSLEVPDLVIIDGGRGHLETALQAFAELNIVGSEVIAVAKDPDRAFLPGREEPLSLEGGQAALLLRRIRDEVHRFAITYHKKLRAKRVFESPLEKIKGVGKNRRFALLRHFGSIDAIRNATVEEIASLKGFHKGLAEKILENLKL